MPEGAAGRREGPQVYSIAAHRGFADALVAGLIPRYAEEDFGLARLTLLLPSQRAARTVTEAFVRLAKGGLLLPRMAVVGDLDLDETLGPLVDPLGAGTDIPPAVDPTRRWLRLAGILREVMGAEAPSGAALLRLALETGRTMDRLLVEDIAPDDLLSERVIGIVGEQAQHWTESTRRFLAVQAYWRSELAAQGEVDAPARRNLLFEHAARRWREQPPAFPIVAAGVTSASPGLARLLRVVSELPRSAVILPDLDLELTPDVWSALGVAGQPEEPGGDAFGHGDAVTHPQYHLKVLLNRMGVARGEVQPWHRAGLAPAPPARSRAISSVFLPPSASAQWADLPPERRRLAGVRLMESAHPGEEAQAIAVLIRQALAEPERRVALITPDRGLASRVVAHLARWNVEADDTAGRALSQTAAGRVLLLLADVLAEQAAPVPLLALLEHPLVGAGEGRGAWLEHARALDLALRGPRPGPGLLPLADIVRKVATLGDDRQLLLWWQAIDDALASLLELGEEESLGEILGRLQGAAERLCGSGLWSGADGRSLAALVEDLGHAAASVPTRVALADVPAILRDAMDRVAVRPPWGGHPRLAIYGLLEARMSRADLVICGGLTEGSWPAAPKPDALLPPAVLRALGVPGADFRIGLAAHDLAGALGAPEVVLSYARRDEAGPVIPSRFVLRVQALLGDLLDVHRETRAVELARAMDDAPPATPYPRPQPMPSAEQRRVKLSATGLDRLRGDPYQFYASAILGLGSLDPLDAEPSAAWKGTAAHAILERWHREKSGPEDLLRIADQELDTLSSHPLTRTLWRPRLVAGLEWIATEIARQSGEGRVVLGTELKGEIEVLGIRLHGRADRIDRRADGTLAIVDYKTGAPPSSRRVEEGFALQLGVLGLIAARGGFTPIEGEPGAFEYWAFGRKPGQESFGFVQTPVLTGNKRTGIPLDDFLPETERYLVEAISRWIIGTTPFTARLNPDLPSYADYDQLMRLDEWQARIDRQEGAA